EEINQEVVFKIDNAVIRPEFEAVKEYFIKILKRKLITVKIAIRCYVDQIVSATAESECNLP
ncbi:MAG: hypothetical protein ABUT20_64640, partial [Bacteroidota bacterium]